MEDSDYDSDDENWNFVPEAIATSGFNSEQRHLLEKYLIAQNYEKMDEEVIFDVAGLLYSLNDTGFMSKLAFNQNFQSQLLQKCFSYGKAGLFTQTTFMQRVRDLRTARSVNYSARDGPIFCISPGPKFQKIFSGPKKTFFVSGPVLGSTSSGPWIPAKGSKSNGCTG